VALAAWLVASVVVGTIGADRPAVHFAAADGPAPGSRGAVDVYERSKASIKDCLLHVAGDLKQRANEWPGRAAGGDGPGGVLYLVIDPTNTLKPALREIRDALIDVLRSGPLGLKIGVLGVACEDVAPAGPAAARDALVSLEVVPLDGPKNLLESVRDAASALHVPATEPRALVLVTREGGDGEDDVEGTRDVLKERGVAFYSIAPEAAFERPWEYDFKDRPVPDLGLTQRWTPLPRRRVRGELFYGCDVAFGLVPYDWELREFPLAQTEFPFGGRGRFPCPSGFAYWSLATLSWTTGGRAFVYDFARGGGSAAAEAAGAPLFDHGFLNFFAPDLRPRHEVLRALSESRKATTIVRIWEYLADEEAPVLLDHGTVERAGASLVARPMRPVRSSSDFEARYESAKDVMKAKERAIERKKRIEQAMAWWTDDAKREVTPSAPVSDPLAKRVEADFELLGFQLAKVRFHWGEVIAALETIDPAVFDGDHRVRLEPVPLATGVKSLRPDLRSLSLERAAAFVDATGQGMRLQAKYHGTPWSLFVEKGFFVTMRAVTDEIRPAPRPAPDKGDRPKGPPPKPTGPPPPPPPPQRPSSGGSGEKTGGGK